MNSNEAEKTEAPKRCGRCRRWMFPFIIGAVILVKSALVMVLWNALIPELFHGPLLSYLQALQLTILAKLLVGFGRPFGGRHGGHPWKKHWAALSPDEREKLRDDIRKRCGH